MNRRRFQDICMGLTTVSLLVLIGLAVYVLFFKKEEPKEYTTEAKLSEAVQILREYYVGEMDEAALADAAVAAMVAGLNDRWSYYLNAEDIQAYWDSQNNQYGGIGLVVMNDENGTAVARKVYAHSPAGEAGIPSGSRFLAIGGRDAVGSSMDETVELLREQIEAGQVDLTMLTPEGEQLICTLIPGEVYTEPVTHELLDSGLGYIRVENFEARSASMAIAAVEQLMAQQVPGIIFDVREDPGGQLSELLQLLDYLLPEGKLFISRTADGQEETDWSDESCVLLPMAVLVDENSYSAAEFFAAALQEYGWAQVVGEQTSGKGRAQVTVSLQDGSAIHISRVSYFTPEGRSLTDVGLTPDVMIGLEEEEQVSLYYGLLAHSEDEQLLAAEALLLESAAHSP